MSVQGVIVSCARHQRIGELGLGVAGLMQALAQVGAEAAQLFDAGDDAVLFGEGRNREGAAFQLCRVDRGEVGCLFGRTGEECSGIGGVEVQLGPGWRPRSWHERGHERGQVHFRPD